MSTEMIVAIIAAAGFLFFALRVVFLKLYKILKSYHKDNVTFINTSNNHKVTVSKKYNREDSKRLLTLK